MLTQEQKEAAESLWKKEENVKALQLIAGAGSGKTTTLVHSVQNALESGLAPEKIALITFTRRAGEEMKERLSRQKLSVGFVGTMHSLALHRLREHSRNNFQVFTRSDEVKRELIAGLFPQYSHIPDDTISKAGWLSPEEQNLLAEEYAKIKHENNWLDFDDIIEQATKIEADDFSALLVDEFQDTSPDQILFLKSLKAEKLFAVGDDWQSIYAFRGANVNSSYNFPKEFPGAIRHYLTQNFRSQKRIVELGNKSIRLSSKYIRKKLTAYHPSAEPCRLFFLKNQKQSISEKFRHIQENCTPQTRVLVRTNHIRKQIESLCPSTEQVLTIHSAKGLEFEHVILFGVSPSLFPHPDGFRDEEVRLFYVAITRAKKRIDFVSWEEKEQYSRFLPFLARNCRIHYFR